MSIMMNEKMETSERLKRLEAYESTGLTPEDCAAYAETEKEKRLVVFATYERAQRVARLMQAEDDGLLVVLPMRPGTEIYEVVGPRGKREKRSGMEKQVHRRGMGGCVSGLSRRRK